jgi:hypothetical protein
MQIDCLGPIFLLPDVRGMCSLFCYFRSTCSVLQPMTADAGSGSLERGRGRFVLLILMACKLPKTRICGPTSYYSTSAEHVKHRRKHPEQLLPEPLLWGGAVLYLCDEGRMKCVHISLRSAPALLHIIVAIIAPLLWFFGIGKGCRSHDSWLGCSPKGSPDCDVYNGHGFSSTEWANTIFQLLVCLRIIAPHSLSTTRLIIGSSNKIQQKGKCEHGARRQEYGQSTSQSASWQRRVYRVSWITSCQQQRSNVRNRRKKTLSLCTVPQSHNPKPNSPTSRIAAC